MSGLRFVRMRGGWAGRGLLGGLVAAYLMGAATGRASAQSPAVLPELLRLVPAQARRLGKPAPQKDARLDAAAQALLALYPNTDAIPNQAASAALWQQQVVEPVHRMLLVRYGTASPQAMLTALPDQLRVLLGSGHWHRFGLGVVAQADGDSRAMILVLESFVQLTAPPPAALGQEPTPLVGTLRSPYAHPKVVVTAPSGAVETPALAVTGRSFSGPLRCGERGRYQVEVLGEDKGGPTVLANFPWYCGQVPGPPTDPAVPAAAEVPWRDATEVEQQALALLNQDRQRASLPPLPIDAALSAVARAHCQDMAEHQFVAHLSPRTGGPAERLHRAGIVVPVITENLAQARSPKEAEDGLMGSPGHRANILDPRVNRVGIGAKEIVGVAGLRQLLLTQLFVGDPVAIDLRQAPTRVVRTLQGQRQAGGQAALVVDAELTALAERTAAGMVSGEIPPNHPDRLVESALPSLRQRFAAVRAALAVAQSPEQIAEAAVVDAAATDIGVAVVNRPAGKGDSPLVHAGAPALYIVVLVARRTVPR